MKITKIISCLLLATAIQACGGDTNWRDRQGLDPDTEEAVRKINLERYAGNWLLTETAITIYLSISEEGYYWTQQDKNQTFIGADFGRIEHAMPGTMVLHTERQDCSSSDSVQYLHMNRTDDGMMLRDTESARGELKLLAVDKRARLENLPCGLFK